MTQIFRALYRGVYAKTASSAKTDAQKLRAVQRNSKNHFPWFVAHQPLDKCGGQVGAGAAEDAGTPSKTCHGKSAQPERRAFIKGIWWKTLRPVSDMDDALGLFWRLKLLPCRPQATGLEPAESKRQQGSDKLHWWTEVKRDIGNSDRWWSNIMT